MKMNIAYPSLVDELQQHPYRFDFFQAVRLLQIHAHQERDGRVRYGNVNIGRQTHPGEELFNFTHKSDMAFGATDIQTLTEKTNVHYGVNYQSWNIQVKFMGLTGSRGVLPYHYSELVLKRSRLKDQSMQAFFDIFNHRTTSLLFHSWSKNKLSIQYEQSKIQPKLSKRSTLLQAFYSLAGMGHMSKNKNRVLPDDALLKISGLIGSRIPSAHTLEKIISSYFEIQTKIHPLKGNWQDLHGLYRTRISHTQLPQNVNNTLGQRAILGKHVWDVQSKISIELGPLDEKTFNSFAPGSKKLQALHELITYCVKDNLLYDVILSVPNEHLKAKTISSNKLKTSQLGWNTILTGIERNQAYRTIKVSKQVGDTRD